MVSKAAVIAIVAILAVPILLGYALNVEQVTETDYQTTGETLNVTPLLQSGTGFTSVKATTYQLNSEFNIGSSTKIIPTFNSYNGTAKTSMAMSYYYVNNWVASGTQPLAGMLNYYLGCDYDHTLGSINFTVTDADNTTLTTVNSFQTLYYDKQTSIIYYSYWSGSAFLQSSYQNNNITHITYTSSGSISSNTLLVGITFENQYNNTKNIDISAGYYFDMEADYWSVKLSEYTNNAIFTIDLDSITDDNYTVMIGAGGHASSNFNSTYPYYLTKTTTDGNVKWTLTSVRDSTKSWELYYDPAIPHNTYQIYWDWVYDHSDEPYYYPDLDMDFRDSYYNSHREFRYVGNWPNVMGEANVYWKVTDDEQLMLSMPTTLPDYVPTHYTDYDFDHFYLSYVSSDSETRSPTVRVDAASYRGIEYPLIIDKEYAPSSFKTNPSTTINNAVLYGTAIIFAGNTYSVKNGNITIDSHKIPVEGLVLSSVPNENGGYDNKIGNTLISSTAQPSSITFNGKWSASITTSAQEEYEVTKTEWKAGDFAWDGIDHNFIMAGLLASIGAFVGVGIYARRTKATVWPLLIVCGGAALLFFVML